MQFEGNERELYWIFGVNQGTQVLLEVERSAEWKSISRFELKVVSALHLVLLDRKKVVS